MSPGAVDFPQPFPRGFELAVSVPVLLSRPRQTELQVVLMSLCLSVPANCLLSVCLAHMSRVLCEPRVGTLQEKPKSLPWGSSPSRAGTVDKSVSEADGEADAGLCSGKK